MAVLDQSYRRWTGRPTSYLQRILVMPRYDLLEIVEKRAWLFTFLGCLIPPLGLALWAYAATKLASIPSLAQLAATLKAQPPGNASYQGFLAVQFWLLMAFAIVVGPPLVTRDFANGGMPLYLSKSLRRWDFVLGRCAVLAALLSVGSWIPYLLVFLLECGMAPAAWRSENAWLFVRIIGASLPAVAMLTVVIVATGALVQRANLARAALLFLLLGMRPFMFPLQAAVGTPNVRILSPADVTGRLREIAFEEAPAAEEPARPGGPRPGAEMGGGVALVALLAWLGAALLVIARRVRPVEVVK
jgi:ABC-type transport system involved in multi-copper enzyme maturation permease subunit